MKKFAIVLGTLIFNSCGTTLPKTPSVDICAHDELTQSVVCVNNQTDEDYILHINETDKYIMYSPEHWGLVLEYIKLLERRLSSNKGKYEKIVSRELKKVILTSNRVMNGNKPN